MLYGLLGLFLLAVFDWEGLLQVREASLTPLREPGISPVQLDGFKVFF